MDQKIEITPTTPTPSPVRPRPWLAVLLIVLASTAISFLLYQNLISKNYNVVGVCQVIHGWRGLIRNCQCLGKEVVLYDNLGTDGEKKTLCLGRRTDIVIAPKTSISSSSTDVSSNWKTYTNFDYSYSLNYPDEVSVEEPKWSDFISFKLPPEKENSNNTPTLWIAHYDNSASLSPRSYYDQLEKKVPAKETKEIKVNGLNAFQFERFAGDGSMLHTYLTAGKVIVDIFYYSDLNNPNFPNNRKNKKLFDQILSTFKFTN